jgi:hypothetical protein
VEDVSREQEDPDHCGPGGRHQDGGGGDVLGATDHRVVLGPRVIDQDFKRGVEEFGGNDDRETEDEADELDDRKAQR